MFKLSSLICSAALLVLAGEPVRAVSHAEEGTATAELPTHGSEAMMEVVGELQRGAPGLRILGGIEAVFAEHPWQAALLVRAEPKNTAAQFCGGSVVAPLWILTAAHCVDGGTRAIDLAILTGTADLRSGGTRREVARIVLHGQWNPVTREHDVALLQLASAVAETPVKLPDADLGLVPGEGVTMTGWGRTRSGGRPSKLLQQVTAPLQASATCNTAESYGGRVKDDMFCAGKVTGGIDTCQGDSGGPATLSTASGPVLVGVTSWGDGCGKPKKYGVYSRVATHLDWIQELLREPEP